MGYVNWERGEFFCDECKGDGDVIVDVEDQEADAPQHCATCGIPFDNPLTEVGVKFVIETLLPALMEYRLSGTHIIPKAGTAERAMTYWHGQRHIEITRYWAQELLNYDLGDEQLSYVEYFLEETEA